MGTELTVIDQAAGTLATSDLSDLLAQWLDYELQDGKSVTTLAAYRRGLVAFLRWLADQDHRERAAGGTVTAEVIRAFKGDLIKHSSPQTVNVRLSALRSFFRFLVTTGRLPTSPAADITGAKRPKSRLHKRDSLTGAEVIGVLGTCQPGTLEGLRDRAILSLMAFCALRSVEVHRANLGNLKTQDDRLVLEVHGKGRTSADEIAVIPRAEEATIRAWVAQRLTFRHHAGGDPLFISLSPRTRGGRLSLRSIRGMVKERYQAAGVVGDRKTTHSLRHTAITAAIRNRATPYQAKALGRHGSLDTTLGYYHEVDRLLAPAEDLINYGELGR